MVWDPEEVRHGHLVSLLNRGEGTVTNDGRMVQFGLHVKDGLVCIHDDVCMVCDVYMCMVCVCV